MGKPGAKSTALISVDVDEKGQVRYDALVKQGNNRNKLVQSTLEDLKEKAGDEEAVAFPDESEEQETANKTRMALEARLDSKIRSTKASTVVHKQEANEPTYIRYTPNPDAPGFSEASKQRVIRMVEAQVDPMEPPKHKGKKVPRGPPSPPVPVLHSPPRKLTVADQQAWKIPPCISNWKNARGYTIPLDKRLAADGRGLQEVTINNKFAMLSEALYISERKAAEDLRLRNQIRKKMAMKEKEDKEASLREMAQKARMNRAGVSLDNGGDVDGGSDDEVSREPPSHYGPTGRSTEARRDSSPQPEDSRERRYSSGNDSGGEWDSHGKSHRRSREWSPEQRRDDRRGVGRDDERREGRPDRRERGRSSSPHGGWERDGRREDRHNRGSRDEESPSRAELQEREQARIERRKERERQMRLDNMKGALRKSKLERDAGRDISEKIALGMHKGTGQLTGEAQFDSRLFNQSAGLNTGFGAEDDYSTYSKPLFDRPESTSVYRPKRDDSDVYGDVDAQLAKLKDTSRFRPDKGFAGTQGAPEGGGGRSAPVQFEKAREREPEEDPFDIGEIVQKKRQRHE